MLDRALLERAFEGCDWVFHLQANADVRHGLEHPRARPRAEHDRDRDRARGDARDRRARDRVLLDRLDLRRAGRCSRRPEDAPFPIQTSLYGASKLAGEGMIAAYCSRLRVHRRGLPLRLDPRRALHPRPRVRLLPRAQARPDAPARARRRTPAEVLPLRPGLRRARSSPRSARTTAEPASRVYNLGTDETVLLDDSIADDRRPHGSRPDDRVRRRRARMARRQPADPPRLRAHPRARLGADAEHSRVDRPHARVVRREPLRLAGRSAAVAER